MDDGGIFLNRRGSPVDTIIATPRDSDLAHEAMPTNPLAPEESRRLRDAAAERLRWCNAVVKRLQDRGYCPNDALLRHAFPWMTIAAQ